MTIALADLEEELCELPKRDQTAIKLAIRRTVSMDAYRWIAWSIKGGGIVDPQRPTAPPQQKTSPKRRRRQVSLLRRFLKMIHTKLPPDVRRLLKLLGKSQRRAVPKIPRPPGAPPVVKPKPPGQCAGKPPPGYRPPVDTGDYAAGWKHEFTDEGGIFFSSSPPEKAGVIEKGRRAAPVPIQPLQDWVMRKLGCKDPKVARRIAIAISKHKAKTPQPGLKVLERAHPKIAEALAYNVVREMRRMNQQAAARRAPPKPLPPGLLERMIKRL
jgi:hypothetical protein